jgi:hypothetical protein
VQDKAKSFFIVFKDSQKPTTFQDPKIGFSASPNEIGFSASPDEGPVRFCVSKPTARAGGNIGATTKPGLALLKRECGSGAISPRAVTIPLCDHFVAVDVLVSMGRKTYYAKCLSRQKASICMSPLLSCADK